MSNIKHLEFENICLHDKVRELKRQIREAEEEIQDIKHWRDIYHDLSHAFGLVYTCVEENFGNIPSREHLRDWIDPNFMSQAINERLHEVANEKKIIVDL